MSKPERSAVVTFARTFGMQPVLAGGALTDAMVMMLRLMDDGTVQDRWEIRTPKGRLVTRKDQETGKPGPAVGWAEVDRLPDLGQHTVQGWIVGHVAEGWILIQGSDEMLAEAAAA